MGKSQRITIDRYRGTVKKKQNGQYYSTNSAELILKYYPFGAGNRFTNCEKFYKKSNGEYFSVYNGQMYLNSDSNKEWRLNICEEESLNESLSIRQRLDFVLANNDEHVEGVINKGVPSWQNVKTV